MDVPQNSVRTFVSFASKFAVAQFVHFGLCQMIIWRMWIYLGRPD